MNNDWPEMKCWTTPDGNNITEVVTDEATGTFVLVTTSGSVYVLDAEKLVAQ